MKNSVKSLTESGENEKQIKETVIDIQTGGWRPCPIAAKYRNFKQEQVKSHREQKEQISA